MKQSKVTFNLKEISNASNNSIKQIDSNTDNPTNNQHSTSQSSKAPILAESLIRKIELSRQIQIAATNKSASLPSLFSKPLIELQATQGILKSSKSQSKLNKKNANRVKLNIIATNQSSPSSNSSRQIEMNDNTNTNRKNKLRKLSKLSDDAIRQLKAQKSSSISSYNALSKIPVAKNKQTKNINKQSASSSIDLTNEEMVYARGGNEHLASDFLLKSISATPTLAYYFPKIINSNGGNDQINQMFFNKHKIIGTTNSNKLFLPSTNHLLNNDSFDLSLNDDNTTTTSSDDMFNDSHNESNGSFNLEKLLMESSPRYANYNLKEYKKRLSQINEESSDRSSMLSYSNKWSSSFSQKSDKFKLNNVNNKIIDETVELINKNPISIKSKIPQGINTSRPIRNVARANYLSSKPNS